MKSAEKLCCVIYRGNDVMNIVKSCDEAWLGMMLTCTAGKKYVFFTISRKESVARYLALLILDRI